MELERVSNIEVSFLKKLRTDLASAVSNLCILAGGVGLFLEADKQTYNPVLTVILVASIAYGIFLDSLPKTTAPQAREKIIDLKPQDM